MAETGRNSVALRRAYADEITARAGCAASSPVVDAFAAVPREDFLGPPPWTVFGRLGREAADPDHLDLVYQDQLIQLDEVKGINTGQPSLWAKVFEEADSGPGQKVLQIGAGAGYFTAILAEIVGSTGSVVGIELEPELADLARENMKCWPQVSVVAGNGAVFDSGLVDRIIVCAGVVRPPDLWLNNLEENGRLLMPLTSAGGHGQFVVITKLSAGCLRLKAFMGVSFYPCFGTRDRRLEADLGRLLMRGGLAPGRDYYLWRSRQAPIGTLLDLGDGLRLTDSGPGEPEPTQH